MKKWQENGSAQDVGAHSGARATHPDTPLEAAIADCAPIPEGADVDPQFPKLIRQTKNDSVLFVTLDLTSETTQQQAALLVGALGLESVWTGDLSKLGSVTFLDGRTRRIISFVQTVDMKKIEAELSKAVDASNGKG